MVMKKEKRKIKRNNYRKSLVPTLKRSTTSDTTTTSVTDFLNLVLYEERNRSIKWFTLPDSAVTASTFEPICSLAGINVSYARNYFVKLLDGSEKLKFRRINSILNMKSLWRNK